MIKYITDLKKNSLVSLDVYLIRKLFGPVWLCCFIIPKAGYQVIPLHGHFDSSVEDFSSRNSSVCSLAIKSFDFVLGLVIMH